MPKGSNVKKGKRGFQPVYPRKRTSRSPISTASLYVSNQKNIPKTFRRENVFGGTLKMEEKIVPQQNAKQRKRTGGIPFREEERPKYSPFSGLRFNPEDEGPFKEGEQVVPEKYAINYEYCYTREGAQVWFNEEGYVHRIDGPAVIFPHGDEEWWGNRVWHRLDGPALTYSGKPLSDRKADWYVRGRINMAPVDLCKKAVSSDITEYELYELCIHKDFVAQQLALNNPLCPPAWKVLGKFKTF